MLPTPSPSLESPPLKLTPKQRAFVSAYMINGFNATQAAIAAKYSGKTARSIGHENLTKPAVAGEIKRLMRHVAMPEEEVIARLTEHARGDLGDVVTDEGSFDWAAARSLGKTSLVKKVKRRTKRETSRDGEIDIETIEEEIEFHNPQFALQLLGKYHGLFSDRIEHTGKDGGPIAFTWQDEAISLIKSGDITYEAALETFDHDIRLVRDLFAKAQVPVSIGQGEEN